jgi:NADH-quinone oxidoreductase subunit A
MYLLLEYSKILIFITIAIILAMVLFFLSYSLVLKKVELEKVSAYECGFDPFGDARSKFDVRFYLVAILFIIFDLEITFLFPWAISLVSVGLAGYLSMLIFLFILTLGFVYEWKKGALDWE